MRIVEAAPLGASLRLALDPVRETQAIFRTTLQAMARPGVRHKIPVAAQGAPGNPWTAALLIALLDPESSLACLATDDAQHFVVQRTGARVAAIEQADFVVADAADFDEMALL